MAARAEKIIPVVSPAELSTQAKREQLHGKPGEIPQWMQERRGRKIQQLTKEQEEFREVFNPLD